MIAYQFYNTKSPLNGLAAKWASENSEKLPVDSREISAKPKESYFDSAIKISVSENFEKEVNDDFPKSNEDFNIGERIEIGKNLLKNKKYQDAQSIFNEILEDYSFLKDVYYFRAIANIKTGKNKLSLSDLTIAAKLGHKIAQEALNRKKILF